MNDALRTALNRLGQSLRHAGRTVVNRVQLFYREKILGQTAERLVAGDIDEQTGEQLNLDSKSDIARSVKPKTRPIRRRSRQKVYRLKGYTTVAKINHKRQSEQQQRILRHILVALISILLLFLLFQLYNPIKDLSEWYRIIGVEDISKLTQEGDTDSSGSYVPSAPGSSGFDTTTRPGNSLDQTTEAPTIP